MHRTLPLALLLTSSVASAKPPVVTDRFGNHAVTQLQVDGFSKLSLEERKLVWHLTLASTAGDGLQYSQHGWELPAIKRVLEAVYLFGGEGAGASFGAKLTDYLKRFYGHTGNHDSWSSQKFVPEFTPEELAAAAARAFKAGAPLGVKDEAALGALLQEINKPLFDPS